MKGIYFRCLYLGIILISRYILQVSSSYTHVWWMQVTEQHGNCSILALERNVMGMVCRAVT